MQCAKGRTAQNQKGVQRVRLARFEGTNHIRKTKRKQNKIITYLRRDRCFAFAFDFALLRHPRRWPPMGRPVQGLRVELGDSLHNTQRKRIFVHRTRRRHAVRCDTALWLAPSLRTLGFCAPQGSALATMYTPRSHHDHTTVHTSPTTLNNAFLRPPAGSFLAARRLQRECAWLL